MKGMITNSEKCELLKDTIYKLYTNEGRSKSYISRLLNIDRKVLTYKINEWDFKENKSHTYIRPSTQKFINRNRQLIKSRLDNDVPISEIAKELKCNYGFMHKCVFSYDEILDKAHKDSIKRRFNKEEKVINRNYDFDTFPNEEWKEILGYKNYYISSMGRVKRYDYKRQKYYLLTPTLNSLHNRYYISLTDEHHNRKNLQIARLVGFAFVEGFSKEKNTINHKDGNRTNNNKDNLEWLSQSENNIHSYRTLHRQKNRNNKASFKKIIYKNKYEFKTIASFSRFINKSETQTRRYLDNPKKYNIEIIK